MIVADVLGVMYFWSIDLNALSLVNLLLAVGISVEFCAHIAYRFLRTQEPSRSYTKVISNGEARIERAKSALIDIGSAVFSGAFCTFLGVITLAGARYPLFRFQLMTINQLEYTILGCIWRLY